MISTWSYESQPATFPPRKPRSRLGVQLVVAGSRLDHFVAWRDRLASNAQLREAYDDLKRSFDGLPMDEYRAAKASFIAEWLYVE